MVKSPTAREPGHECAGGLHPSDHPQLHDGSAQIGAVEAGWMMGGDDGGGDGEGTHAVTSTEPKLAPSRSQLPPARKMQTLPELWNVNELQG